MKTKSKTSLWYIGVGGGREITSPTQRRSGFGVYVPVVYVTANKRNLNYVRMRIRSITPRAAARRYIRNNLTVDLATLDFETLNCCTRGYMELPTKEMQSHFVKDVKRARIEVIK